MEMTLDNFTEMVLEKSQTVPVVVDFWAPWCDPCLLLEPILTELEQENNGQWKLIKINIDESISVAEKYHIRSVPTVCVFHNGEIAAKYNGLMWKKEFGRWIDNAISNLALKP
ncbi:MAG: thioredoxin [Sphingobacteriales bacterium]|nr:MAG: thioredoxin [Sphingobacteriales bacterium]